MNNHSTDIGPQEMRRSADRTASDPTHAGKDAETTNDSDEKAQRIAERIQAGKRTMWDAMRILMRWEEGYPLADLLARPRRNPALYNGLFLIFRHWFEIDWVLSRIVSRKMKRRSRQIIRWGTAHILYSDRVPPPIMVDACVTFAREVAHAAVAGFVNAVLRQVSDHREEWLERLSSEAPAHVRLGFSDVLWGRWRARFSPERLRGFSRLLHSPAPVVIRPVGDHRFPDEWPVEPIERVEWAPDVPLYRVTDAQNFFEEQRRVRPPVFYAQDPATLLAPRMLAPQPGERVADLCSAPGGKALCLAEALNGTGTLVCADKSIRRLQRVCKNLRPFPNALYVTGDAARPPFPDAAFDAILLDVPCTNTGVFRRRPDALIRFSEQHLAELVNIQRGILDGVVRLVRPGGRVVYSTCSIEPEENAEQVRRFCERYPDFRLLRERELLPCDRHDGAYAALLVRE